MPGDHVSRLPPVLGPPILREALPADGLGRCVRGMFRALRSRSESNRLSGPYEIIAASLFEGDGLEAQRKASLERDGAAIPINWRRRGGRGT
jgi:hypothetical protein